MSRAWWIIGVGGRIIIVLIVALVCAALFFPFFTSHPLEFVSLSGEQAESRIGAYWLFEDVDLKEIEKASGKVYSQIDCHARWFQITLRPEAAEKWQEAIHVKLEKSARIGSGIELVEGVHRTVSGANFMESSLGKAPNWWLPPIRNFRVTERMRWGAGANYADGVYSVFDTSTKTLWIYDFGQQHGQLWSQGLVPSGEQFVLDGSKDHEQRKSEIQKGSADKQD